VEALGEAQNELRYWDVEAQLEGLAEADRVVGVAEQSPRVVDVEGWVSTQTSIAGPDGIPVTRTYPDQGHGRVSLVAVPSHRTSEFEPPELLDGRWLRDGETGALVLNQIARGDMLPDVAPGDPVQLLIAGQPTTWTVVGIVEEPGAHAGVYATVEGFAEAIGRSPVVNQLRIVTESHDEQTRQAVADDVEETLADAGIDVASATSVSRGEAITEGHIGPLVVIIVAIAVAMGVVGVIGLASTMSANVLDRTREFGVMHAVGARPTTVRRIVLVEGVLLAVISVLVAIAPALALDALLGIGLGELFIEAPLPYRVSMLSVGIWLAFVTLGAVLATDTAANRASRLTVREALAYL
jgi:putative ABC transport system permease protein